MNKILVIDSDKNIFAELQLYLNKEDCVLSYAENGKEGLKLFNENAYQMVLLDVMLSDTTGWEMCKSIRRLSKVPILMLTNRDSTLDKVYGLNIGADDYIIKPFEPEETIARIKAALRRFDFAETIAINKNSVTCYNLTINILQFELILDGKIVHMPPKELELLFFLASHSNTVFTREELLEEVWGYEMYNDSRTVDVHIKRIRTRLSNSCNKWSLKTVWGVGYKFECQPHNN